MCCIASLGSASACVDAAPSDIGHAAPPLSLSSQVIAILIGTNNEMEDRPAFKLGVLLTYLERVYPDSKLLVIPPPPSWQRRYIQVRDAYGAMLRAHPRVFFSLCGAGLDPASLEDFKDAVGGGSRAVGKWWQVGW